MGLEPGWVTDSDHGLTDNQKLTALGNGVLPLQAAIALRNLITVDAAPHHYLGIGRRLSGGDGVLEDLERDGYDEGVVEEGDDAVDEDESSSGEGS